MNQTTLFRFLIVASIALGILGAILDLVIPGSLPAELMLTEAAMMMWGGALAMAYFSELRSKFEASSRS